MAATNLLVSGFLLKGSLCHWRCKSEILAIGRLKQEDWVLDGNEPPCGYWELNLNSLQEQEVFLPLSHLCSPYLGCFRVCAHPGLGLPHDNCALFAFRSLFDITQEDVLFLASPLTFDPSVVEIFVALSSGACLLIAPTSVKVLPSKLADVLFSRHRVTVLQVTSGATEMSSSALSSVRCLEGPLYF